LPNMYVCTYMLHTKQQIIFEMYWHTTYIGAYICTCFAQPQREWLFLLTAKVENDWICIFLDKSERK
jgi:hypothetical protein